MPITATPKPIVDRPQWEMCNIVPFTAAAGTFIISSTLPDQFQLALVSATSQYLYDPKTDAWIQIQSGALLGVFGAGNCGSHHPNGPTGTALAGSTTTTLNMATAVARNLAGYVVRITAGTGAGQERTIASNTVGANAILTVSAAWTVTPDATSVYLLLTGRFYCLLAGAASQMKYYDLATNTWSASLLAGTVMGTDARLRSTPGTASGYTAFSTGNAAVSAASTLVTAKTWTVNQWTNYQVRILSGTGAGQVRTIASNTATTLTVSAAWTTIPDATSVYVIEGNDDFLYLAGNAAVAMYRYSIAGNTWATLSPGAARAGAPGAGMSLNWVRGATRADWAAEAAIKNGRYLYSWRGAAGAVLDAYDIAGNTWINGVSVWPSSQETFSTGTCHDNADRGRIVTQKDATGRFFLLDVANQQLTPLGTLMYPQGAAVIGDRLFTVEYTDTGTTLQWIYFIGSTLNVMFRCLLI